MKVKLEFELNEGFLLAVASFLAALAKVIM